MDVFAAVADPTRREMLGMLASRERAAGEFVAAFSNISQPAVSRHLKVLREAGLVRVRTEAQRRVYAIRPDRLREIESWLAPYRQLWSSMLDALEAHLDQNPHPSE